MKLKYFGPGLLYAGAAVGVSHLVQSTRAGALYGFDLVLAVLLVNILKYPFFEIGTRYTIATGKPLQSGYQSIGNWALWVFMTITLGTMFIIVAVVTLVTAGLFQNLIGINLELWQWSGMILSVSTMVLMIGKYKVLDSVIRVVIILLTISTLVSLVMAIMGAPEPVVTPKRFDFYLNTDIVFLVALLGWMPIPIEAAVWQSDWTLESKEKNDGKLPSLSHALIDFRVGYWGTTALALAFLSLGAIMMHGSGEEFSPNAVAFSDQLVRLISNNLGSWAYPFIALAASLTMVSTTVTCLDAYPRVVTRTLGVLYPNRPINRDLFYRYLLLITAIVSTSILLFFQENMRTMVDFATTVSFLTAPILAFLHYKITQSKEVRDVAPVGAWVSRFSILGIVFLGLFSLYYMFLVISK
jgi:Mn2+/Fe2+ NRAMP family transporter